MSSFLKGFISTFILVASFVVTSYAQSITENIGNSIGGGNVAGISKYFDKAVALSVAGSQSTYSRSQGEMVLRDFFSKNGAKGFVMEHSGANDGNSYAIGTLNTANGKYRIYFSVREKEEHFVIQEIRIEK